MPGQDQTGPLGEGPLTGRGLGRCNPQNTDAPQYPVMGLGRGGRPRGGGRGRGWGGGPGRRGRFYQNTNAVPTPADEDLHEEVRALTEEVAQLRAELRARHESEDK